MALLETRIEGFQDIRFPTCPGTEGDIRAGTDVSKPIVVDQETARVMFTVGKVMLQHEAHGLARLLTNMATGEKPLSRPTETALVIGNEVVIPK